VKEIIGRLHSIETLGTRDAPGLRCVFFLAGCNYHCQFCQNPDTWTCRGAQQITLEQARKPRCYGCRMLSVFVTACRN